jgi:hypothetical protein
VPRRVERCFGCGCEVDHDAAGLNKKLLGENVSKFFCLPCLAENLGVSVEDLLAKIEEFKAQGCKLFG